MRRNNGEEKEINVPKSVCSHCPRGREFHFMCEQAGKASCREMAKGEATACRVWAGGGKGQKRVWGRWGSAVGLGKPGCVREVRRREGWG